MPNATRIWVHYLIYSHFWIATSTVFLGWQSLSMAGLDPQWDPLALFLFAGTLTAYSLQRLVGFRQLSPERQDYIGTIRTWWPWLVILGALLSLLAFDGLVPHARMIALAAGFLSIAYIFPIGPGRRIRDIPGLKIFLISLVWALTTSWLPLAQYQLDMDLPSLLGHLLPRALFIFAITLPFDLRDLDADQTHRTLTLPLWLGWPLCRRLGWSALILAALMDIVMVLQDQVIPSAFAANLFVYGLAGWMIHQTNQERSEQFFSLWLDGLMFLPFLLTSLFSLI